MVASTSFRACRNLPTVLFGFILLAVSVALLQITHLLHLPSSSQPFNTSSFPLDYDGFPALPHFDPPRSHHQLASHPALQRLSAVELGLHNARLIESLLEEKVKDLEEQSRVLHKHLSLTVQFSPLKDEDAFRSKVFDTRHYFISSIPGRGKTPGPPELFYFPSSLSHGRFLCLKGNDTSYGNKNFFAFVFKEGLPLDAQFLPGITLISDSQWDFVNPWHSLSNLLQFVHWKMENRCARADRLFLYHLGEHRNAMGGWITAVLNATGLPSTVESLNDGERPVCFQNAILSREGIGGLTSESASAMYTETRCRVRQSCNVSAVSETSGLRERVQVTLVVRTGARGFIDEGAWREMVKQQCEQVKGCTWSALYIANLSFCEQVRMMTETDILVSAHGAQLTNMIFMSPGGRVLEMFPGGWLELAGFGQYIYKLLARTLGVQHEGYWRDPGTPACPKPSDELECFFFYKDQPVGINATYIGQWLRAVILDFVAGRSNNSRSDEGGGNDCKCRN